jgi:hypothetical protein
MRVQVHAKAVMVGGNNVGERDVEGDDADGDRKGRVQGVGPSTHLLAHCSLGLFYHVREQRQAT